MKKKLFKIYSLLLTLCVFASVAFGCGATAFNRHTEAQTKFLAGSYLLSMDVNGKAEESRPLPIVLSMETKKSGYNIVIELKGGEKKLVEKFTDNSFSYYNSELGREYIWYLTDEDGEKIGSEKRFLTSDVAPRNLYVDGVTNCRDLGGWKVAGGKRVKQGMIYRTARFSEDETGEKQITDAGIKTLKDELGVKTELDLRLAGENAENGGLTESPLGTGVNYISVPMVTGGNYLQRNLDVLPEVFAVFGKKENYPIAFHCSIGTDRTGVIAFLISAMLGVEKDSLYKDYLFSNFGLIGGKRSFTTIDGYLEEIEKASGETLADKTYNYLVGCGVSSSTLDLMRSMLIE